MSAHHTVTTESHRRSGGFTYLGVLFALALLGMSLAAAGSVWTIESRRAREAELLWTGNQFRNAISSYVRSAPGGARQLSTGTVGPDRRSTRPGSRQALAPDLQSIRSLARQTGKPSVHPMAPSWVSPAGHSRGPSRHRDLIRSMPISSRRSAIATGDSFTCRSWLERALASTVPTRGHAHEAWAAGFPAPGRAGMRLQCRPDGCRRTRNCGGCGPMCRYSRSIVAWTKRHNASCRTSRSWISCGNSWSAIDGPLPAFPSSISRRTSVVVVGLGRQRSGGYTVQIDRVEQRGDVLVVHARAVAPGRGCIVSSAVTSPADVALLRRPAGAVAIEVETVIVDCRQEKPPADQQGVP